MKNVIDSWINTNQNCRTINDYEVQLYKGKVNLNHNRTVKVNLIKYFKALKWLEMNGQYVCPCSMVSTVKNVLHLLIDVKSKSHFTICLINGLGANLIASVKDKFSKMVKHIK